MAVSALEHDDGVLVYDSDSDTTVENDVFDGPVTLKRVHIFNDSGAAAYVKLHDSLSPSAGTTEPNVVIMVGDGVKMSRELDYVCGTGLSVWCSTAGGKAAGSAPGSNGVTVALES